MKHLTQSKRDLARKRALSSVTKRIGAQPTREQFNNYVSSKYPRWFMQLIAIMLVIVAFAAGIISGVRLYVAGYDYALDTIKDEAVSIIIGICTVLAAEVLVILATVAGQVYLRGRQKIVSAIPVIVGMIVAFVGNWTVTDPATIWGWVETGFPPIAVLSVAFFFEITLVPELERRQADDLAFQQARNEWATIMRDIESHPEWISIYATALRDELLRTNQMAIEDLTPHEWREIVNKEIQAEQWWNSDEFSLNSRNTRRQDGKRQFDVALEYLEDNPKVFEALRSNSMRQSEAAYHAGVSQPTLSRAYSQKVNQNGQNHGD
jgi:hypothetical protein